MTKIFPFAYADYELSNGLRLIVIPTGAPHIVSLQIVVHVGSRNETEVGKSGFAHLFEHMMFRGTEEYPPDRYEAVLKDAGAAQNAYTDDDLTVYHTTFTREDLPQILAMEADRFQNLDYPEDAFRTEARAVLAEYNKDSAEPFQLLNEKLREAAFERHPYQHTTMGFLRDIEQMPELYEYSRAFHKRFYRPDNTTMIVAGDVAGDDVLALVEQHWGAWERGFAGQEIPEAPPLEGPKEIAVQWPAATLPIAQWAWRMPAYSDSSVDTAVLDVISYLFFSMTAPIYEDVVLNQRLADVFYGMYADHVDPYLYVVTARLRDAGVLGDVEARIVATLEQMRNEPIAAERLEQVKQHLRYSFAMRMDHTEGIAGLVARYVALKRSPETINRLYEQYAVITPADVQRVARQYFTPANHVKAVLKGAAC